jgi:hypothetical protein
MTSLNEFLDNLYDALLTVEMESFIKGKRDIINTFTA